MHYPMFRPRLLSRRAATLLVTAATSFGSSALVGAGAAPATRPSTQPAVTTADIAAALRPGRFAAEVVTIVPKPRQTELSQRLQRAIAADPQWAQAYIKQRAKPGEPLPYDPKLGLTEREYAEFLDQPAHMKLVVVDRFDLVVEGAGPNAVRFVTPARYPAVNGASIDFATGLASTRFGNSIAPEPVAAVAHNLGAWSGQAWHREESDAASGALTISNLTVGKFQTSGDWMIEYADGKSSHGRPVVPYTTLLLVVHRQP